MYTVGWLIKFPEFVGYTNLNILMLYMTWGQLRINNVIRVSETHGPSSLIDIIMVGFILCVDEPVP